MFKLSSFIPLLNFFLAPLFGMFAAGDAGLAALGGGTEGAVVDSAVESEGGAPTEGTEGEPTVGAEAEGTEGEPTEKPAVETSGKPGPQLLKPLSSKAVAALKTLKETDREAWKELNNRIYDANGLHRKIRDSFPEGGLDAAIEAKQQVEGFLTDVGSRDLDEVGRELNGFRAMDKQILAGDIAFLKEMPPEMLSGLYNMMPQFVDQWLGNEQTRPFAEKYFAGLVVATMRDSEFTLNLRDSLRDLERMGLDDAEVKSVYERLKACQDWIKTFQDKAAKQIDKPAAKTGDGELNEREQRVQQGERKQMNLRIGGEVNRQKGGKLIAALKAECGGKIPGHVNVGEVIVKARTNLAIALGQQFSDRIDQYIQAGDEQGAIKYTLQQMTDQRITDAVTKAYRYLYRTAALGSPKPPPPGTKPGTTPNPPPPKGVTKIAYNPKYASIDKAKTEAWAKELGINYAKLVTSNRAVRKADGKRVTWDQDAENEA